MRVTLGVLPFSTQTAPSPAAMAIGAGPVRPARPDSGIVARIDPLLGSISITREVAPLTAQIGSGADSHVFDHLAHVDGLENAAVLRVELQPAASFRP